MYTLRALSPLSGIAKSLERHGALIRVESSAGTGFADVHPWTELGDAPLAVQLTMLAEGRPTALGLRSLALAGLDAAARAAGRSAFADLRPLPLSHRLLTIAELAPALLAETAASGFRTLKFKFGAELEKELRALKKLESELSAFKIRLDANGQLDKATYLAVAAMIPPALKSVIEFVEDPIRPSNAAEWQSVAEKSPFPLAIDRVSDDSLSSFRAPWIVLKPAVQSPAMIADWAKSRGARVAVTSYLDHPVGHVGAALEAARLALPEGTIGTCGFTSYLGYEPNEFSELLSRGPEFKAPPGHGIGFNELLSRLEWKSLK